MMQQSFPMRVIQRMETYLPGVLAAEPTRQRRGWMTFAGSVPSLAIAATQLALHRANLVEMWSAWRSIFLNLLLLVGGAFVIAGVAAGLVTWRADKRRHA